MVAANAREPAVLETERLLLVPLDSSRVEELAAIYPVHRCSARRRSPQTDLVHRETFPAHLGSALSKAGLRGAQRERLVRPASPTSTVATKAPASGTPTIAATQSP